MVDTIFWVIALILLICYLTRHILGEVIIAVVEVAAPAVAKKRAAKRALAEENKQKTLEQATSGTELLDQIMENPLAVLPVDLEGKVKEHLRAYSPEPISLDKSNKRRRQLGS